MRAPHVQSSFGRILLVDDHSILRAGIRKILQKLPRIEVVAEAADGREAIALVGDHHPDVVFMDIAMSGMNGLEATARLTRELAKNQGEIEKVEQKLNNPAFAQKVPPAVLEEHKQRLLDWQSKRAQLQNAFDSL